MKTYHQIPLSKVVSILSESAQGMQAMLACYHIMYDAAISLNDLISNAWGQQMKNEPYYFAIREMGVESGNKKTCIERCQGLGYPIVIAKVEVDNISDFNLTIMFTHKWMDGDNSDTEQEFNSL